MAGSVTRPALLREHEATIHDLRHIALLVRIVTDQVGPLERDEAGALSWLAHQTVERAEALAGALGAGSGDEAQP